MRLLFLGERGVSRALMAQAIANQELGHSFDIAGAGLHVGEEAHAPTLALLNRLGHDIRGLVPEPMPDPASYDIIIGLSDRVAEHAPGGRKAIVLWPFDDPTEPLGIKQAEAERVARVYGEIARRVEIMAALPLAALDQIAVRTRLQDIDHETTD